MKAFHRYKFFLLFCFLIVTTSKLAAQEVCNNGKDDDNNGLIDLSDPACQCHYTVNGNLLQNGSFESFDHCPANYTYVSDYKIANYWEFGTYTDINEADFYHNLKCTYDSTVVSSKMQPKLPLPDGSAYIGIQNTTFFTPIPEPEIPKNYVGQCLQSSLKKGEQYTLSFYAGRFKSWDNKTGKIFPFTVAVFGNTDCNAAPFGKKYAFGNGCPANYAGWIYLGETTVNSVGEWVQNKINFLAPDDIKIIEVGPSCAVLSPINDLADSTTFLDYHLYYLDDLHLLPTKDFPFEYIQPQLQQNCNGLPVLKAPVVANATYQWYKDSIAIVGATNDVYSVSDVAGLHYYSVLRTGVDKCVISEPLAVTTSKLNEVKIPVDTGLCPNDTLQLSPALTGIIYTVNGIQSNVVAINKAGIYTVLAADMYGCEKVFNVNVANQNCTDCNILVPTAFTPNNDGLNDVFRPRLNCFASSFHINIFNRWGKKIFESSDIKKGWNGVYAGLRLSTGAYVYYIEYKTTSGITKTAKGVVTLML